MSSDEIHNSCRREELLFEPAERARHVVIEDPIVSLSKCQPRQVGDAGIGNHDCSAQLDRFVEFGFKFLLDDCRVHRRQLKFESIVENSASLHVVDQLQNSPLAFTKDFLIRHASDSSYDDTPDRFNP